MLISSEYVSNGHPDRLMDNLASKIIDDIQKKDGFNSHAAIEAMVSDDTIFFGGEVCTTLKLDKNYLKSTINTVMNDSGYIPDRRKVFTKDEVYLANNTKFINKIHTQSPDIAKATTDKAESSGWNDQNISYGSYDSATPTGQGIAKYLAQSFGDFLFEKSKMVTNIGSDIKIVFTLDVQDKDMYTPKAIKHVTVAIPNKNISESLYKTSPGLSVWLQNQGKTINDITPIEAFVINSYFEWTYKIACNLKATYPKIVELVGGWAPNFTVNGTGRYVNHGYHSDSGLTGRKLAVNNMSAGPVYSMNQIGGGSYIKPFHASDLILPMIGNWIAKAIVDMELTSYANVAFACTIGSKTVDSICITGDSSFNKNINQQKAIVNYLTSLDLSPNGIAKRWGYPERFNFYEIVKSNFVDANVCPWYNTKELEDTLTKVLAEAL